MSIIGDIMNWFKSKAGFVFTLLSGFFLFLLSFWLISRDNGFFSGDMGIMGLIVDDMSKGDFYSWYFYGQDYFGNLEPLILVPLTFITGNSIKSLYFWESFFYFISITFLLFSWKKRTNIQTFLSYLIMFFSIQHIFPFTYFPQGFAFVSMIILGFYFLFKKIVTEEIELNKSHFFLVGFFTALSLWHNLLVGIIFPIFGVIILWKLIKKEYKINLSDFLFGLGGSFIGGIPFVLATIQTDGQNLNWFISNTDSSKFYNIYYVFRDLFFYFLNASIINTSSIYTIFQDIVSKTRNFGGLLFIVSVLFLLIRNLKVNFKESLNYFLFLIFLLLLLLVKDYAPGSHLFYHIRYAVPFYTMLVFLVTSISFKNVCKRDESIIIRGISIYALFFLILLVPLSVFKRYQNANTYSQFYENVFNDVYYEYDVRNLYCDNYYDVCGTVAYLGKDLDFNVQMINSIDSNVDRNPRAKSKVDEVLALGGEVLSLIRVDKLKEEHEILDEFVIAPGAPVYYLIKGDYK